MWSVSRNMRGALALTLAAFVAAAGAEAQERKNPFDFAKSWGYQLRELGPAQQKKIAASPYDVVIIDNLLGAEDQGSGGNVPIDEAVDEELREWIERRKASFPDSNV